MRKTSGALLATALLLPLAIPAAQAAPARPVVKIDSGALRGTSDDGVHRYRGVPFAAPPTGANRWRPPQPPASWRGVRDAGQASKNCLQAPDDAVPGPQSEDCLYLNVTTPARPGNRPRPVMLWLYGGGFFQGAGNDYDARRLAATGDVVVVTPNYRLGVFGFLGYPGLNGAGSFGLQDQQAALQWVKRNAAAFGGDPANVTLFGESAGAMSTCAHLTAPATKGLFRQAAMQSGTCLTEWPTYDASGRGLTPFEPLDVLVARGTKFAADLNCRTIACLRAKPPTDLLGGMKEFGPAFGTPTLPEDPAVALRAGRFHHVPVLIGANRDEARVSLVGAVPDPLTDADYRSLLQEDFGATAAQVLRKYPPVANDNGQRYADLTTDRVWAHTTRNTQQILARRVPTFAFEFADREAPLFSSMPPGPFPYGAYHGAELMYLYEIAGENPRFTPAQRRLADRMIRYWAQFAHTGNPNRPGLPTWPRAPYVQSLHPKRIGPVDYAAEHQLGFWTALHGS